MSNPASADTCYRHPGRQSYVLCQRCGRTICPECQTQAAVGVHCPECVAEARASAPRTKPAVLQAIRRQGAPVVTYSIIGVTAAVYLLQLLSGGAISDALVFAPFFVFTEPWRMLTALLVHSQFSFFHILFNMFALWMFGRLLEPMLGRWRFLALYVLSGLGGSVAAALMLPLFQGVVGASGAVFGLFSAFFVIQRRLGGNSTQLLIIIGINLAIGFFVPGIAWQAHLGGLVVGALVALVLMSTRRRQQQGLQVAVLAGLAIALFAIAYFGVPLTH